MVKTPSTAAQPATQLAKSQRLAPFLYAFDITNAAPLRAAGFTVHVPDYVPPNPNYYTHHRQPLLSLTTNSQPRRGTRSALLLYTKSSTEKGRYNQFEDAYKAARAIVAASPDITLRAVLVDELNAETRAALRTGQSAKGVLFSRSMDATNYACELARHWGAKLRDEHISAISVGAGCRYVSDAITPLQAINSMVIAPTGGGKTNLVLGLLEHGKRLIFVSPLQSICEGFLAKANSLEDNPHPLHGEVVRYWNNEKKAFWACLKRGELPEITSTTYDGLPSLLEALLAAGARKKDFVIIFDEVHNLISGGFKGEIFAAAKDAAQGWDKIALTGTYIPALADIFGDLKTYEVNLPFRRIALQILTERGDTTTRAIVEINARIAQGVQVVCRLNIKGEKGQRFYDAINLPPSQKQWHTSTRKGEAANTELIKTRHANCQYIQTTDVLREGIDIRTDYPKVVYVFAGDPPHPADAWQLVNRHRARPGLSVSAIWITKHRETSTAASVPQFTDIYGEILKSSAKYARAATAEMQGRHGMLDDLQQSQNLAPLGVYVDGHEIAYTDHIKAAQAAFGKHATACNKNPETLAAALGVWGFDVQYNALKEPEKTAQGIAGSESAASEKMTRNEQTERAKQLVSEGDFYGAALVGGGFSDAVNELLHEMQAGHVTAAQAEQIVLSASTASELSLSVKRIGQARHLNKHHKQPTAHKSEARAYRSALLKNPDRARIWQKQCILAAYLKHAPTIARTSGKAWRQALKTARLLVDVKCANRKAGTYTISPLKLRGNGAEMCAISKPN